MENKTITIMLGMILLISSVSALTIIAGSSYSFESEEYEYYTVVGNSSNMDGLEINWEDGNTTISFDLLFKPDNFTLIFFNQEKEIITVYRSGGSSRTIYKDKIIDNVIVREVDKIVEVTDDDEINRLIGIANESRKGENKFKILFVVAGAILLIIMIIKIKRGFKN